VGDRRRRRSEVASATLENLQRVGGDGARSYFYTLAHSKTIQAGAERPEDVKPLVGSAAQAMQEWLAASGRARHREGAMCVGRVGGEIFCTLAQGRVRDGSRPTEHFDARDDGHDRASQRGDRDGLLPRRKRARQQGMLDND
jgi:hypothetical protein